MKISTHLTYVLLFLSIACITALLHYSMVSDQFTVQRLVTHNDIIGQKAPAPYVYRILIPFIAEFLRTYIFNFFSSYEHAFVYSYITCDIFSFFLLFYALFLYVKYFFSTSNAFTASLMAAATIPVTFSYHYYQPWSWIEPAFIALSLLFIAQQSHKKIIVCIIAASLNRETAVFIPLLFLLTHLHVFRKNDSQKRSVAIRTLLYFSIWASIFIGLRMIIGYHAPVFSISQIWNINTEFHNIMRTLFYVLLLFGAGWITAIAGFRTAPLFIKRAAAVIPFYLLIIGIFGVWHEIRLLLFLYPLVIPLILSYLYDPKKQ